MGVWGILLVIAVLLSFGAVFWFVILPHCRYAFAWISTQAEGVIASAEARKTAARSRAIRLTAYYERNTAEQRLATRRLNDQADATDDGVVKQAWLEGEIMVADATTQARIAAAKQKYGKSGRSVPKYVREFFWDIVYWGMWIGIVLAVVSGVIFGVYQINSYATRDHQATVIVCEIKPAEYGNPPSINTSNGKYRLDPGWYGKTYYPDPDPARSFFHAGQAVRITFHGGQYSSYKYATAAEVVDAGGKTCAPKGK